MDDRLLDAVVVILAEHGVGGLTLERVAERAGRSRVTLWRQGVTQDSLIDGLLSRLTRDYRDAMWSVLADSGTGADRHLHLLTVNDAVFHQAADRVRDITGQAFSFLDPFTAALRAGAADKTLQLPDTPAPDLADAVFNTVCWGYVHLRNRHGWPDDRARGPVLGITLAGFGAPA